MVEFNRNWVILIRNRQFNLVPLIALAYIRPIPTESSSDLAYAGQVNAFQEMLHLSLGDEIEPDHQIDLNHDRINF